MCYVHIEKEVLAATWARGRLASNLLGLHFTLQTDHKPLVPLLSTRGLDDLPPQILRFRLQLLQFSYIIDHVPGKQLITADALSRAPLDGPPTAGDLVLWGFHGLCTVFSASYREKVGGDRKGTERGQSVHKSDRRLSHRVARELWGWPAHQPILAGCRHITHGLLMKGERPVIPSPLRADVLQRLHEGHQGISKCRARAKDSIWWPGISAQIVQMVERCVKNTEHSSKNHWCPLPSKTACGRKWVWIYLSGPREITCWS